MQEQSQTLWVGLSFLAVGLTLGFLFSGVDFNGSANTLDVEIPEENAYDPTTAEVFDVSADDDAFLGDANAPVVMVEFSDYQCPYCNRFRLETLPLLKENYIDTGKLKFVYRDLPLPSHKNANLAAQAAECVGEYGDNYYFWMHDLLFENTAWSGAEDPTEDLIALGGQLGTDIRYCVESGQMAEEVNKDYAAARSYGLSGTPSLFVNGKKIVGAYPYEVFEEMIEAEL